MAERTTVARRTRRPASRAAWKTWRVSTHVGVLETKAPSEAKAMSNIRYRLELPSWFKTTYWTAEVIADPAQSIESAAVADRKGA